MESNIHFTNYLDFEAIYIKILEILKVRNSNNIMMT